MIPNWRDVENHDHDDDENFVAPRGYASRYASNHSWGTRGRFGDRYRNIIGEDLAVKIDLIESRLADLKDEVEAMKRAPKGTDSRLSARIDDLSRRIDGIAQSLQQCWEKSASLASVRKCFDEDRARISKLEGVRATGRTEEDFARFLNPQYTQGVPMLSQIEKLIDARIRAAQIQTGTIDHDEMLRRSQDAITGLTQWANSMFFSKTDAKALIDGCFPNTPMMAEISKLIDTKIAAAKIWAQTP